MGKMVALLIIVFMIQLSLYLFDVQQDDEGSFFNFLINPTPWSNDTWFATWIFLTGGAISIAVIGGIVLKNDLMVFAGAAGTFLLLGMPIASLWNVIGREAALGDLSQIIASIIVSPIIILYIMTALDWWKGKD